MIETGASTWVAGKGLIALLLGGKAAKVAGLLPFMLLATERPQVNVTRIVEALLIAGLATAGTAYATIQVLETRMAGLEKRVTDLSNEVREIRSDLYIPRMILQQSQENPRR